mgnify:CR=1 FL=1
MLELSHGLNTAVPLSEYRDVTTRGEIPYRECLPHSGTLISTTSLGGVRTD